MRKLVMPPDLVTFFRTATSCLIEGAAASIHRLAALGVYMVMRIMMSRQQNQEPEAES